MCLSLTPTGSRHAVTATYCANRPADAPYILLPLPGAPPFKCDNPCGGFCPHQNAYPPAIPTPAELTLSLRLAPTLAHLLETALAATEPAGTADDLSGPAAWGCPRYYRN